MDCKNKILGEIVNAREMIKMLYDEIDKLEERVYNGAISNEDAFKYAKSWIDAIERNYLEIDLLKKKLFE